MKNWYHETILRSGKFYILTDIIGVQTRYPSLERALFNLTLHTTEQHSKIQD